MAEPCTTPSPRLRGEGRGEGRSAAVAALMVAAFVFLHPAVAQQTAAAAHPAVGRPPLILQPPAPDFAPAPAPNPRLAPNVSQQSECAPAWPCRLRLFGVIDKTGGVGLKGPVLNW